ncbi:MAG TPA: efflux RND transporter periplasmic adaptor subunit [Thermoanaerobaculia bacterium]|nr:efflux RND transporter periplasmic adaptor subunit [Thermoanaerobaculia bacterium]
MISIACGVALFAGCGEGVDQTAAVRPPAVEAVEAREGELPLSERVSGRVRAENQVAIHAEIEAPVVEVLVRNGEQVRRGQPLVRLDGRGLREQLRQAEASVRLAEGSAAEARARVAELEAEMRRTRALAAEQLVSSLELETLEARVAAASASADQADSRIEQARATADERRSALARTVVRAPVEGRIGQRNAEVGMIASPGTLLFLIGDFDELTIEIPLTQQMLEHVREGDPVRISSPALGEAGIDATLSRISPFLGRTTFSTTGEIDLRNDDRRLRPGMFVTVDILYGESGRATLVPASAIWEDPRTLEIVIFAIDLPPGPPGAADDPPSPTAHPVTRRPVEVLAEGMGTVGVRGIEPGEWVVVMGQHLISERESETARARRAGWERVLALQGLQREDLLAGFLARQQQTAKAEGIVPPSSEEYLGGGAAAAGQ